MTLGTQRRVHPLTHLTGAASSAVRPVLESARAPARVLAAVSMGVYLEVRTELEPSVIALITGEATRLPNSVLLAGELPHVSVGDEAAVGDGVIELGRYRVKARRWWDPSPALPSVDLVRLAQATSALSPQTTRRPGLEGNAAITLLASGCAAGSLLRAVTAAEQLVGLGPGLTPSGDDVLAGLLVALRHLGSAAKVERAVWLADWLAAAVTFDAGTRTTPISATLLHCAARGEASPEVSAVLRGITGQQALEPALRRLLQLGHTSGADLAQGVRIGLDSVLALGARP
ncbi:DUF2877 domain-containing protein [Nonomuraea dietziae]|uniref:DUF2877 domain-containing protein n=1 Tax=Nonomuraea dietziae TaxID=65515 RepID=A0A7W5V2L8_9ACTN|nr:DUF2877 domain-containing protein [Nonomuraea dietziae]MBB3726626.1 hypothetical protein [Nonomuraea dietziae]